MVPVDSTLPKTFEQYTSGDTDVSGLSGGFIGAIGWDFGVISEDTEHVYLLNQDLMGGSKFTATLNWFVGREWLGTSEPVGLIDAQDNYYTDLALEMYRVEDGELTSLIARSNAQFINTEHFHIDVPATGRYAIKVRWNGERYDVVDNDQQTYGLAWFGEGLTLIGDVNRDGVVNLLDVTPFVELVSDSGFQLEADVNQDGIVNLLDVQPFVLLLSGG